MNVFYRRIFMPALFINTKNWKQSKYASTEERIYKDYLFCGMTDTEPSKGINYSHARYQK